MRSSCSLPFYIIAAFEKKLKIKRDLDRREVHYFQRLTIVYTKMEIHETVDKSQRFFIFRDNRRNHRTIFNALSTVQKVKRHTEIRHIIQIQSILKMFN